MTTCVPFKQMNAILKAGPSDSHNTCDLPVCKTKLDGEDVVVSCWVVGSMIDRIKMLFTGRVYLVCKGHTHPPLYVEVDIFDKE